MSILIMKIIVKLFGNIFFSIFLYWVIFYVIVEIMDKSDFFGWEIIDLKWMKILNLGIFRMFVMSIYKKSC